MPRPSRHRACDDFHRTSTATRERMLGGGLTRRQVIGRGLGAGLAIYAARAMPVARMLEAAGEAAAQAPDAPVLVSVFLAGGADLLDTLVPLSQYGAYADKRPQLKLPQSVAPLGATGLGVNPALQQGTGGGIAGLYGRGQVGFLPGIDYANPDLSHFHSRHFWETGLITDRDAPGWLGRWLDASGNRDNPLQGISMTGSLSPVLRSTAAPVAAIEGPGDAQLDMRGVWGDPYDQAIAAWNAIARAPRRSGGPAAAGNAAAMMADVATRLKPYVQQDDQSPDPLAGTVAYPAENRLADRLKTLAGLLAQPLGIRIAVIEGEGEFDTHDNQREELDGGLAKVSAALAAFQADLAARGLDRRVTTFVWSEFGRRAEQNDSGGTDHGAGGVAWVQGARVKGGILSDYPSLGSLDDDGNLAVTVDFRRVYCSLLEQWLGTDAGAVIPDAGGFGRIPLIA